jgi:aldose sugar dehydrogenase
MTSRLIVAALTATTFTILASSAFAQGRGGGGPQAAPLPTEPWEYQTAEGTIRVRVLASGLENPWSLEFLPDASILITERNGRLRHFKDGVLSGPVPGLPEVVADNFISGLHDIKLHPDFAENRLVYWVYNKADAPAAPAAAPAAGEGGAAAGGGRGRGGRGGGGTRTLTVARGVFDGTALTNVEDIIRMEGASTVSRMLFLPDGTLLVSTWGEPEPMAQDKMGLSGKILRYNDDGTIPRDNPFVGDSSYRPEIYSLGHRTPESLVWHEPTGTIWESEMGPHGGDEVNIIQAGKNYGWPVVSYGRSYAGPRVSEVPWRMVFEQPVVAWVPSIAVSGLTFYTGDRFPRWKNNLFVGGLRQGEVPRTGQLQRIEFNDKWEEIRRETLLRELNQRIRDVREGPDGLLYVLTAEAPDGAVLRLEPSK